MRASWKQSTRTTATDYRRCHIDGAFKDIYVDSLTEADVAKWFAALTDNAGPGAANRCMDILRAALNKAEAWGYRVENTNPCYAVRCNRKVMRTRHLSEAEMARLGAALADLRDHADQSVRSQAVAITLLLLTGCRRGEIPRCNGATCAATASSCATARPGHARSGLGRKRSICSPATRARPKSLDLLERGWRRQIRTVCTAWRLARTMAGLRDFRLHDLRHTFASHAAKGRESLPDDRQASGPPLHQIHGPLRASG
jgi:integrase